MKKASLIVLLSGLMLAVSSFTPTPAFALLTWINPLGGGTGSEPSLIDPLGILDTLYGLANLTRIDDDVDQVWENSGTAGATAQAKYAAYTQALYAGPYYIFTIDGTGIGTTVTFTASQSGSVFKFYDDPNGASDPPKWSSVPSENPAYELQPAGLDRMVTWEITGNTGYTGNVIGNYVIGWEDKDDQDYNDIVFELANVAPVPEPTSMLLLGMGLVGLVGKSIKKRFIA